jgi:thioredoxin 1
MNEDGTAKLHKPFIQTIKLIISLDDYKEFIKENPIVLLEIKAKWCHSSNLIQPHCKILSEKYINFKFASIDVDYVGKETLKKIDEKLSLSAIPSFYLFMNGALMDSIVAASPSKLESFIESYYEGEIVKTSNSNYEEGLSKKFEWNSVASNKELARRPRLKSASLKVKSSISTNKETEKLLLKKETKAI